MDDEDDHKPAILILANKSDLEEERAINRRSGEEAARAFGAKYAEVSAKTGEGVDEVRTDSKLVFEVILPILQLD